MSCRPGSRACIAALAASLAILASCDTPAADPATFRPTLRWVDCPDEVEVEFISDHACGELEVLQSRDQPRGPTVTLRALKAWPSGVDPDDGQPLGGGFGSDLGSRMSTGGDIAAGASRAGRVVLDLAQRGTAVGSSPGLTCPEVDEVRTAGTVDADPASRRSFVAAVTACARRLRSSGIVPADYGAAAKVQDLEDLRTLLGQDQLVSLSTYGTESHTLAVYLATHPGRAGYVVMDSPGPLDLDVMTAGAQGTDSALATLFSQHPGLQDLWEAALRRTGTRPLSGTYRGTRVVIDDAKLLRMVRYSLGGDGPEDAIRLPGVIAAAAAGRLSRQLARLVAEDPPFCAGYRPICGGGDTFAFGAFLTGFCEQMPVDLAALHQAVGDRPAWSQVFAHSPYDEACRAWGVSPSPPVEITEESSVPVLLLTGELDSFSRPEWNQTWIDTLGERAWSVTLPGQTHNVLGFSQCAIDVRGTWREHPTERPPSPRCLSGE